MPSVPEFLTTWFLDPVVLVVILIASVLYIAGIRRAAARGIRWSPVRTFLFFAGGLGSYAVVSFGFLGVYSVELRWAFATRIALLLFATPALLALGAPLGLLRASLGEVGQRRLDAVLESRASRILGNAMFATLFSALVFTLFLTPVSWVARGIPPLNDALGVIIPLIGIVLVLPIAENAGARTGFFLTVEFILAFAELIIDAIPGIVLRLNDTILDGAPVFTNAASWWPSPLHDQHLAGDMLWFLAEVADVPLLVALFVRWARTDRKEAKSYDDLDDAEWEKLQQEHLRTLSGRTSPAPSEPTSSS